MVNPEDRNNKLLHLEIRNLTRLFPKYLFAPDTQSSCRNSRVHLTFVRKWIWVEIPADRLTEKAKHFAVNFDLTSQHEMNPP